jgi:hypothetical protein
VDADIIKKSSIEFTSGDTNSTSRDVVYSTTPVATTSYTDNIVATLSFDIKVEDFIISVSDSSSLEKNSFIAINNETLKVTRKNGNELTVSRGQYGTPITNHVLGSPIKLITSDDNDNIKFGDDFGFNIDIF